MGSARRARGQRRGCGGADVSGIIDELRREFPAWTFTLDKQGDPKAWKGPREPLETESSQYAIVERSSSGRFNGFPLRGGSMSFDTLLDAAEYALGETAASRKVESKRGTLDDIDAALAELREAYPACTWDAARGKDARGSCIHVDEDTDSPIDVQFIAPGRWLTIRGNREWRGKTALESFRRYISGLPCDITTTGRVIDAEVPSKPEQIRPAHYGGPDFHGVASELADTLTEKNARYGNSFAVTGNFLRLLWPDGCKPEDFDRVMLCARMFDKMKRLAAAQSGDDEDPLLDLAGYAVLGLATRKAP